MTGEATLKSGHDLERVETRRVAGGMQEVWMHHSQTLRCDMRFAVFLPPQLHQEAATCPVVYFLSGLTCTEQNAITKAGAQRYAAEHGLILVCPDTSPRGDHVADDDAYDLGKGAGFYVNATQAPWAPHFQMYDYIVKELVSLVDEHFPSNRRRSVMGHSMGGHGALIIALKNPGMWQSVSALAPIVAPSAVPWGHKALGAYLGDDHSEWQNWDACALVANADPQTEKLELLVDQGTADNFLDEQLQPERLRAVCDAASHPLTLRMQEGYDHSYYFIASFIGEHLAHHARHLRH